ncbi:MAG: diguanylate cyclase [Firmicutes bacterium]|nr:diguanylate cyclase [Bacillota bacterium]
MSALFSLSGWWLVGLGLTVIIGALAIFILNYLVNAKTKALYEINEQLRQTQSQNKAIINAIPDVIFILDNESRVLEYKSDEQACHFPERTLIMGRKLSEQLPGDSGRALVEAIGRVLSINDLQTVNFSTTNDGEDFHYEIRLMRSGKNEIVALCRDMTPQYKSLENIKYLSYHDQLTGLYNRYMFEEEFKRLDVSRNFPLSIIMADVNGLKLINDCFGHPVGDQLLISFADALKKVFRADDIICRLGGDEFIVILPQTTYDEAERLIDRIQKSCGEVKFFELSLSVAFGVATKQEPNDAIKEVMKYAEDQMYKRKLFEGPVVKEQMVEKLLVSLFEESPVEKQHSDTVALYSVQLGEAIGLNETELETLRQAAVYHDIGKIAIPKAILEKQGQLMEEEMEQLKTHADIGYRILSSVNGMAECADVVLSHHEHWNGKGYPKGISGDEIPILSRIISLSDAFAAMTHERLYKPVLNEGEALEEIERYLGIQFDPVLGRKFISLHAKM